MLETLITPLAHFATTIITSLGYTGVALAMAIESACIPLPSEIIMPFSGYLVSQGKFTLLGVTLAGTIGGLIGSLLTYALGYFGGESTVRQVIRKYGRYVFVKEKEFDHAVHWFDHYGSLIAFFSRLLPVIRTFISLPAGIAKMSLTPFILYTTIGSFIWSYALAYLGLILGENWDTLGVYFHKFDLAIVVTILITIFIFIYKKYKYSKTLIGKIRRFLHL